MRVLFSTLPSYGHFYPMVPLASALRAAGHDVLVAAAGNFAGAILGAGLPHVETVPSIEMRRCIGVDRAGEPVPDPPEEDGKLARSGRGFGRAGLAALDAADDLVDTLRPDVVVVEPTEYAVRLAAARRDIPFVVHDWGLPVPSVMAAAVRAELAPERAERDPDERAARPDLVLRTSPGDALPADDAGLRMRFVPYNGVATLPSWLLTPASRPRVALTFGTMIGNYPGIDRAVGGLAALLAGQGYEVLLAVSAEVAAVLPPLPDGVRQVGYTPLNAVLPGCDLLVHHGGSGSAMTALATGTPQVVMPHAADQFSNSAHVHALRAGIGLTRGHTDPDQVREACASVLGDPAYAARAGEVAAELAARPAPVALVSEVERLAARIAA